MSECGEVEKLVDALIADVIKACAQAEGYSGLRDSDWTIDADVYTDARAALLRSLEPVATIKVSDTWVEWRSDNWTGHLPNVPGTDPGTYAVVPLPPPERAPEEPE